MPEDPDGDALATAVDVLLAHREGVLEFGDEHIDVRFVCCNESGRIIMAAPIGASEVAEGVLHVPGEQNGALHLLLSLAPAPESAATDRWRIYHGAPNQPRWVMGEIESAKHGPWVFQGEELTHPNILIHDEPSLLRDLNADRARLAALCRAAGTPVEDPVAVGVHQHGIHVRARYGVVHLAFPQIATDAAHARRIIAHMLEKGRPASP